MMGKTIRLLAAALTVVLAASCSEDDDYLPGSTDTAGGDVQEYTLTVGMDYGMDGDTRTRATSDTDDQPTRCLMQVFDGNTAVDAVQSGTADGNNYSFTVSLVAGKSYTFCFWADNGTQEITSLTEVPYNRGTVAFAANPTGTPETVVTNGIKLAHVVAKVSLVTTAATTIVDDEPFTAATQCAATYNALTCTASGTQDYATPETSGSFSANEDVTSFYVLPAAETQSITLNAHLLKQTVADVPLSANTHTILQGDFSENNDGWTRTPEYYEQVFMSLLFNENGIPRGIESAGVYYFYSSDATNRRILPDIMKVDYFPGMLEYKTTVWGEEIFINYLPSSLNIIKQSTTKNK